MRRIGAEEPAAVGPQVLDGNDRGDRAAGRFLLPLVWPSVVGPIAPGSTVATWREPSSVMGTPSARRITPITRLAGTNVIGEHAPHVEVVVAHVRVAAQAADDRRQAAKARRWPKGTCSSRRRRSG